MTTSNEHDDKIAELLEQARAEAQQNGVIDEDSWRQFHPDEAAEVLSLFKTMQALDTAVLECRGLFDNPPTDTTTWVGQLAAGVSSARPDLQQLGRYQILDIIGAGGMGTVYRAFDPQLQRIVAIKVPNFSALRDIDTAKQRFLREARSAAKIRHPNVCPIYDVCEQDGLPYVVMAFIDGPSLADRLASEGRFDDCQEAVRLVCEVAEALQTVHRHGIVHRDLKPSNIVLDRQGRAILTDFGLARPERDIEKLTGDGERVGTPGYMAPEQAVPQLGPITYAVDVFSLGAVLYRMVTGQVPFAGPMLAVLSQADPEIAPPSQRRPGLDAGLEAIILKAMSRRPEDRFPDIKSLRSALMNWFGEKGARDEQGLGAREEESIKSSLTPRPSPLAPAPLSPLTPRPSSLLLLTGGLALIGAVIVGVSVFSQFGRNSPNASAPPLHSQNGVAADTPGHHFITSVYRGSAQSRYDTREALRTVLPLRSGDKLILQGPAPANLHVALFMWTLTDSKPHVQELGPLELSEGKFLCKRNVELAGSPATEVLFLCGSPERAPTETDITSLLQSMPGIKVPVEKEAWLLPGNVLLSFQSDRLDTFGHYPRLGHGRIVDDPVQLVAGRLEKLRRKLRESYPFVSGVCITHVAR